MGELDVAKDVCFVGLGASAPCYYRVMLPAMALGCDWAGVAGVPPSLHWLTGSVKGESKMPDLIDDYKIVVLQQPCGEQWLKLTQAMQEAGKKVLFEVDDYLHGIAKREDHHFKDSYDQRVMLMFEDMMRACDGIITSTEYIAKKYKKFNSKIYVCRNGIDLNRYELSRPDRKTVNIGWAGATGHTKAIMPWMNQVLAIMQQKPETCFVSIGQPFADAIRPYIDDERAISVPWAAIEQYPSAMSMIDVALAPAGAGGWYLGKSDLRWLEAGALGIPIIANRKVYKEIEDGVTGFLAENPYMMSEKLMPLIADRELRLRIGDQAKEYVREHRSIQTMSEGWVDAFGRVNDG